MDVTKDLEVEDDHISDGDVSFYGGRSNVKELNLMGKRFDTEDQAYEFYKEFAKQSGFGVRRSSTKTDRNGNIVTRQFVWFKEGHMREIDMSTRKCATRMRVRKDKDGSWFLSRFDNNHNHPMCPPSETHFIHYHRDMSRGDLGLATVMKSIDVGVSKIYRYFVRLKGGGKYVGFGEKDLSNALNATERAVAPDGDVNALISYYWIKRKCTVISK